ncbi:MAG: hypothetical protein ACI9E1_001973 [Cryomorphaceae bacterium]|jgi:hypothetical protein
MKKSILIMSCIVLQSCSCAIYTQKYELVTKSRTISPTIVSEFAQAKKYKGNPQTGYSKQGTIMQLRGNTITLRDSFCPSPVSLLYGNLTSIRWAKNNTELKEWFHAMNIPLKSLDPILEL